MSLECMAFGSYKKGTRAEVELIKMLKDAGFSAIRAAGSGGGSSPCPDILAFKNVDQFGFECKSIETENLLLRKEQILDLIAWQENTNITSFIAWRQRGAKWYFIRTDYLKKNTKSFSISIEDAKKYGVGVEEIIKKKIA